ncbi:MAG: hypothetical protein K940chlam3_00905 [Chlamydiae bacterium]|nr:hypothetical protein [Chlamydiota bacterium]
MSEKKNIAATRCLFEEVFSGGDLDALDSLIANNIKLHDPSAKNFKGGIEAFRDREEMYTHAFPNKTLTIDEIYGSSDTVTVRWTAKGTHDRDLPGVPSTGKKFTVTGTSLFKYKNGKIIEIWQNWDEFGLLNQLGALSAKSYAAQR